MFHKIIVIKMKFDFETLKTLLFKRSVFLINKVYGIVNP